MGKPTNKLITEAMLQAEVINCGQAGPLGRGTINYVETLLVLPVKG